MSRRFSCALVAALGLALGLPGVRNSRAASAPEPRTLVVVIENMKFTPAALEIRPGDRVTFRNADLVPHTATTKPKAAGAFDSRLLKPGESWSFRPDANEPIHYACAFHPMMEGVIVVKGL